MQQQEYDIYEKYGQQVDHKKRQEKAVKRIETAILLYVLVTLIIPISLGLFIDVEFALFHSWRIFLIMIIGPASLLVFIVFVMIKTIHINH